MIKSKLTFLTILCALGVTPQASGSEAADKAVGINCFPGKKIVKIVNKFSRMKPEHTDTVRAEPEMKLAVLDGGLLPQRVFYRAGEMETGFELSEDGSVTDFAKIGGLDKKGEMCIQDGSRLNQNEDEDGMSLSMKFDVRYQNKSGSYALTELKDGLADGKRHYKKLVPGPADLLIPSLTHVGIKFTDDDADGALNKVEARKDDQVIDGLVVEQFAGMSLVRVEQLEDLGADRLIVQGGAFNMMPLASIEKLKKFGFADEDEQGAKEQAE